MIRGLENRVIGEDQVEKLKIISSLSAILLSRSIIKNAVWRNNSEAKHQISSAITKVQRKK